MIFAGIFLISPLGQLQFSIIVIENWGLIFAHFCLIRLIRTDKLGLCLFLSFELCGTGFVGTN